MQIQTFHNFKGNSNFCKSGQEKASVAQKMLFEWSVFLKNISKIIKD